MGLRSLIRWALLGLAIFEFVENIDLKQYDKGISKLKKLQNYIENQNVAHRAFIWTDTQKLKVHLIIQCDI